ncbi:TspO/MBR family protein [Pannonibacter indicus]|jgi:benzodiazapine receptor|uniref:TspO and MBR related proteins n=1 Tax=Pannonibacter indicus TaxID=466044 RepID=A0A0K6I1B3_9HYPH|nr:TspO/MBR family protein [Pannonibacter indicus]CUA96920.1 TspO and MBR related proteins [Pannonibacter indicus]
MTRKPSLPLLAVFLVISVGGGLLIGATNLPGEWYAGLAKPSFTPPNWLFAPVWTVLYILIGIAGWRSFGAGAGSPLFWLWVLQMVLNFAWSPTVFTFHRLDAGLGIILALLASILAFIATGWQRDRLAALLFVPYAAWAGFATALNLALVQLN